MIRDHTRHIGRFFQFELILFVSTVYSFEKPGQMHEAMDEEVFPQDSVITCRKKMTVFFLFFKRISLILYTRNIHMTGCDPTVRGEKRIDKYLNNI